MRFTNWLAMDRHAFTEAASQAYGLRDFVRMSDNRETALWSELDRACEEFKAELIKRGLWEEFAEDHGMDV